MVSKKFQVHELIAAAIKAADEVRTRQPTNSPVQLTTCLDALNCLKALSLSPKDLMDSSAVQKMERLRHHQNPNIATEVRSLFGSWTRTLYAKPPPTNKSLPTTPRCETAKALSEKQTQLLLMFEAAKKAADTANAKGILLGQPEASRCVAILSKLMSFTVARNVFEENRIRQRLEHLTKHKNRKICSSAALLLQRWNERTPNPECQASSKTSMLRDGPRKAVPNRPYQKKQQHPLEVSPKPRDLVTKKTEINLERTQADILKDAVELSELFEAAKKAADRANAKGLLLGQSDSSLSVHCLEKLKIVPVNWEVVQAHGMERKLEHLTKHKDRKKICSAAAALLQHWRQSNGRREPRVSATKMMKLFIPNSVAVV